MRSGLQLALVQLLLSMPVAVLASPFCPPLPRFTTPTSMQFVKSGDIAALLHLVRVAPPGSTLLLADGVYPLRRGQSLEVQTPGLTIRSASGHRDAVVITGGYNNISVNVDHVTIADLTLKNPLYHNIQVRGERGILRTKIYNVHLLDSGQQFVKVSTGESTRERFADYGEVACSLIEYSQYAPGTASTPPSYTNGVDILAGKGWVVRDNVFRRIRSRAGPAGPAILAWKNALDTVVQRNLIIDSWRGVALGLQPPNHRSRGGAAVLYDHQNGLIENNVILALNESADAAIENNFARNSRVFHNTIYYNPAIHHAVNWSIEYRFAPTTAIILNNLTNMPISKRRPAPRQTAPLAGNMTHASHSWFRDITAGDFHLIANSPAIDQGSVLSQNSEDFDGDHRPSGPFPDVGADEFRP